MIATYKCLQVDLISSCNATCSLCSRQDEAGRPQNFYPKNRELDLRILEKVITDPSSKSLEEIFFCGNYGDALASPRLLSILDFVESLRPGLRWNIHTNGSLGTEETWLGLAERTVKSGRLVKFAIDGLEDTNALYRRGVSWSRVMANAKLYLDHGGRAVWKYVVFPHNSHQIEEARELSKNMGFLRFEVRQNYLPGTDPFSPGQVGQRDLESRDVPPETLSKTTIECDSEKNSIRYLDFDGHLWPCCWIPDWKYSSVGSKRRWHAENIQSRWGADFNDLGQHEVGEVLDHPWFREELKNSWTDPHSSAKTHPACVGRCGQCRSSV